MSLSFSPNASYLASSTRDSLIRIWRISSGRCIWILSAHESWVTSVTFSSDGQRIFNGSWDSSIRVWELTWGRRVLTLSTGSNSIQNTSFSPDRSKLASASRDGSIRIFDTGSPREVIASCISLLPFRLCFSSRESRGFGKRLLTFSHDDPQLRALYWSRDGTRLVSGSSKGSVCLWDTITIPDRTLPRIQKSQQNTDSCSAFLVSDGYSEGNLSVRWRVKNRILAAFH